MIRSFYISLICILLSACGDSETLNTNTLRIATWNIYWLTDHGFNTRNASHYDALNQYAFDLNADIIALQEVENADYAKLVLGDAYDYYFSNRTGGRGTQRVGIAVKKSAGLTIEQIQDYTELDVGSVRYGVDMIVSRNNQSLRLLAVHLKSGCFEEKLDATTLSNLTNNLLNSCTKLSQQMAIVEDWVDQRAQESVPFILLGDFNRRFDRELELNYSEQEGFWSAIDDPEISAAEDLNHLNAGITPSCWNSRFNTYIDHIITDPRAHSFYMDQSFSELVYSETDYNSFRKVLSDHCAIFADFAF